MEPALHKGPRVSDLNIALAIIANEAVDCFVGNEQPASYQPANLASCTGGVFWGKRGEAWPRSTDDRPLIPWLQVVCGETHGLHGAFFQKQAVCFFIREPFTDWRATSSSDHGDFVVRTYEMDDELVPLSRSVDLVGHPFHRIIWARTADYPSLDKYSELFDDVVLDTLDEMQDRPFKNRSGIKIGGWPTPVQGDQRYPGSCDLQIDMTQNFMYGDSGIGYLNHAGERWHLYFECM